MPEIFLILLAGGVLLAAAISDPNQVTLLWLRLCGIIALSLTGLSLFFFAKAEQFELSHSTGPIAMFAFGPMILFVLLQVAGSQIPWRRIQRIYALLAFCASVFAANLMLRRVVTNRPYNLNTVPNLLALAGIAAMTGLVLMDMLLGHAYLTASRDRKSTRLNSSHHAISRMPSSA